MTMSINTNLYSLNAQANLNMNQSSLQTSMQRLSSGLRINSAADDAAGLAISQRMQAQVNGMTVAGRNANDAISMTQTADSGLSSISDSLQRMRELAVQSANATNSPSDRSALQQEVSQLASEIDRVATQTQFNGTNLLDGTGSANQQFQVGANAGQTITVAQISSARASSMGTSYGVSITGSALNGTAINSGDLKINTVDVTAAGGASITSDAKNIAAAINASNIAGVTATALATSVTGTTSTTASFAAGIGSLSINNITMSFAVSGNQGTDRATTIAAINANSAATGVTAKDTGSAITLGAADGRNIAASYSATTGTSSLTDLGLGGVAAISRSTYNVTSVGTASVAVTGAAAAAVTGIAMTTSTAAATGTAISAVDISTLAGANAALTSIDAALTAVNSSRAILGATQNRFNAVVAELQNSVVNQTAAKSRITDADFATETANLSRAQILQQAGTAMVAQANQLPQGVLKLLG